MDQNSNLLIIALWIPQALRQALLWLYWIQTKEYRWDRFQLLLDSKEGQKSLELPLIGAKIALIFFALFFGNYFFLYAFLAWLNFRFIREILTKKLRKPVLTLRAKEILLTTLISVILTPAVVSYSDIIAANLAVGELLLLILPFVGIVWTLPLVNRAKKKAILEAKAKLEEVKPTVVGITGSYGKSTTKDFLRQLLAVKFKTEATEKSENTEFGVARKAAKLEEGTEMFVVEMGAYKNGEIFKVAKIVDPKVGVLTGIEPQHMALFGSLEKIKKTKYELIKSLPADGVAFFNVSNKHCKELAEQAVNEGRIVYTYGLNEDSADTNAIILSQDESGITFELHQGKTKRKFATNIQATHLVENLVGAIAVARFLDVDWPNLQKATRSLVVRDKTMTVTKTKAGALIIDDSYNSTPKAFLAAVEFLKRQKNQNKVVITPGVIELGRATNQVHKEIGQVLSEGIDEVYLTSHDFEEPIRKGLGEKQDILKIVKNPNDLRDALSYLLYKNSAILLEGRMPASIVQLIEEKKAS